MILDALSRALGQLGDPAFRRVILRGVGLTLLLFAAVYGFVIWVAGRLVPDVLTLPVVGEVGWLDSVAAGAAVLVMLVASVFLMIPIAAAFTSLFLDEVADAVETRHYPHLPAVRHQTWREAISTTFSYVMLFSFANIFAVLAYALFPPAAPVIFFGLNGWLLGQEYFQLAAARRVGPEAAKALRQTHAGAIWAGGALMAVPLMVPILNLVVPVVGAATFTHLYHRLAERS